MKNLLTAQDIAARYRCSEKTARRYMQRMDHMTKPLRVTEDAVEAWEVGRLVSPSEPTKRIPVRRQTGRVIISRVRGA